MITEEKILGDICRAIPLMNVQTLHVAYPPSSPAFWRKMLGHLHDVRYLKLSHDRVPNLVPVLRVSPSTQEGEENHDRYACKVAPALEELELEEIIFFSEGGYYRDRGISQRDLFNVLSTRGVLGGRFTMIGCSMDDLHTLDMVRSWDGLINIPVVGEAVSHCYEVKADTEDNLEDDTIDSSEDESEDDSDYD